MNQAEFDALDKRIRAKAERMWQEAGSPEGDFDSYMDEARELIAMGEVALPGSDPYEADPVEEASVQLNLGEFPTLRDQGDEQVFPDDNDIHLSDGDASEQGGVLPNTDLPENDLPDVPSDDADITSDDPEEDLTGSDLPDAGLPDLPPLRRGGR